LDRLNILYLLIVQELNSQDY